MTSDERDLRRLLHGELPPGRAAELRARLAREPELARAFDRLDRSWQSLSLPPPAPVPIGFAHRVAARAAGQSGWALVPVWVRATAAAALVTGVALGAGLGLWTAPPRRPEAEVAPAGFAEETLAESYWQALSGESDEARP